MIHWILHVRQRVVRQELARLRQLRALGVQEDLEGRQLSLQVALVLSRLGQRRIDGEVDVNVELQLLALQIVGAECDWYKTIPRNEEVLALSKIESIEHVADASVLIEEHVPLKASILGLQQLVLELVD